MPRDDTSIRVHDPLESSSKGPLRRGDACLYCRKRRIKCTAEKPACPNCTKLGRECVYDNGKPVSRVKQLEEKVAELEDMLKLGPVDGGQPGTSSAEASRSGSLSNGAPSAPPLTHSSSDSNSSLSTPGMNGFPPQQQQQYQHLPSQNGGYSSDKGQAGLNGMAPPFTDPFQYPFNNFDPSQHTTLPADAFSFPDQNMSTFGSSRVDQSAVDMFDFSTLDPGFMNLVSSFGATSTGPEDSAFSSQSMQQSQQAQHVHQPPPQAKPLQYAQHSQPTQSLQNSQDSGFNFEMELDYNQPTGLTPFMDPTYGEGLSGPSSQSPAQFVHSNSVSPPSGGPSAMSRGLSIQPAPIEERVSYHAYVSAVPDTTSTSQASHSSKSPGQQAYPEVLWPGNSSMPTSRPSTSSAPIDLGTVAGTDVLIEHISRARGEASDIDWRQWAPDPQPKAEEARSLVGGWFDPADLPRVARDHL
jgi:hypothetical protein